MTVRYFLENILGAEPGVITVGEKEFEVGANIFSTNQPFEISVDSLDPSIAIPTVNAESNAFTGEYCCVCFGSVFIGNILKRL